jgi:hypothetical protein
MTFFRTSAKVYSDEGDVIKTIGKKLAALEYLGLSLKTMEAEDAVAELKRYLPSLKGVIKEVQDGSRDRVKKTVKF